MQILFGRLIRSGPLVRGCGADSRHLNMPNGRDDPAAIAPSRSVSIRRGAVG